MELPALDSVEIRILGCLVEKEMATPDYYPLTLKALTAACNQKSNRNPVMELSETDVLQGLDLLRHKGMALVAAGGGRVPRYGHNLEARLHLEPPALAVLCELMIRGPQTIGELRTRAERLHPFDSLQDAEAVVRELADNDPPLLVELPRQPGSREHRYKHLLGTGKEGGETETVETSTVGDEHKIHALEKELASLREEVEALRRELAEFKSQFE